MPNEAEIRLQVPMSIIPSWANFTLGKTLRPFEFVLGWIPPMP